MQPGWVRPSATVSAASNHILGRKAGLSARLFFIAADFSHKIFTPLTQRKMKKLVHALTVFLFIAASIPAPGQAQGGRNDRQIETAAIKIIKGKSQFKNVTVQVEDAIATLRETVELESSRVEIGDRVGRIANIAGVRNEVVLDPPAMPDEILLGHVTHNLIDAGYEFIRVSVHNGSVVIWGTVRTWRDREWLIQTVRRTEGVKEVESRLSVASYDSR